MARRPDPTDPSIDLAPPDPTRVDAPIAPPAGGHTRSFRDEPTAAAETRTVKWDKAAPWLGTEGPEARPSRPRDPMFWPAVVFVGVLALAIAYVLVSRPHGH